MIYSTRLSLKKNPKEEIALPVRGRKNNLNKHDIFDYFAVDRLGLNQQKQTQLTCRLRAAACPRHPVDGQIKGYTISFID